MDKQDAGNMIVLTLIELGSFILGHLFLHHFQGKIQLLLCSRHFRHLQLYFLNSRHAYEGLETAKFCVLAMLRARFTHVELIST